MALFSSKEEFLHLEGMANNIQSKTFNQLCVAMVQSTLPRGEVAAVCVAQHCHLPLHLEAVYSGNIYIMHQPPGVIVVQLSAAVRRSLQYDALLRGAVVASRMCIKMFKKSTSTVSHHCFTGGLVQRLGTPFVNCRW